MLCMNKAEFDFWNNPDMVGYFASKPADPVIADRLAQLEVPQGAPALDLGCGGGRHSQLLAEMGFSVYGVDVNPAMIEATRLRFEQRGLSGSFTQMSIGELGFRDNSFSVAVSTGVLHQAKTLDEYNRALSEISRVLNNNGLFSMNIFTNSVWDETYTVPDKNEPYTVVTQEGLWMTLLSKDMLYKMASTHNLLLEQEVIEELRQENTGPRAVLRAHLRKVV